MEYGLGEDGNVLHLGLSFRLGPWLLYNTVSFVFRAIRYVRPAARE
jgi:hypothetical protein